MKNISRRNLLQTLAGTGLSYSLLSTTGCAVTKKDAASCRSDDDWCNADRIRAQVTRLQFRDKTFDVRAFGAKADGATDSGAAINSAIKACNESGGGRVLVPAGHYLTGPIHLLSNVNLHLEKGCKLSFSSDPDRYLPAVFTRWEGMEMMGYSPLIYAYQQENIALTGAGVLDGGGNDSSWWPWKGEKNDRHWDLVPGQDQAPARKKLFDQAEQGLPPRERIYADKSYLRPSFVQPYECKNVLIEGVTIINSPFWLVHPVLCENVRIEGISCKSHGPNNDGCDPESCKNVVIENCYFDTGDDCIALKSGRNEDGRRVNVPCENVVIANCQMRDGHGGLVIGSEISGGARNIYLEKCEMSSKNLEKAIRIKTNARRGGLIENIRIRDIKIGDVQNAVVINFYYEEGDVGEHDPIVRDIEIRNLICSRAERAFFIRGFERAKISDLRVVESVFHAVEKPNVIEHLEASTAENVLINGRLFNF